MYEKLVKLLRDYGRDCEGGNEMCRNCTIQHFCENGWTPGAIADAIERLQCFNALWQEAAIIAHEREPKWIPVTERLPNCNGCYLVWRPHFFGGEIGMPSICYFDGTNTWHDSYGVDFTRILHSEDVTHWMPLPEPPKEET